MLKAALVCFIIGAAMFIIPLAADIYEIAGLMVPGSALCIVSLILLLAGLEAAGRKRATEKPHGDIQENM